MRQRAIQAGFLLASLALAVAGRTQEPGQQVVGRGQFAGMQRVGGEVTAVSPTGFTLKDQDGALYQVTTTPNTRMLMGQGEPLKLTDLKVGDGVMAAGNLDTPNKTLHAALIFATPAEQLKKLRDNLGKTYIAGKVTAIDPDNLKMTVKRADGVAQTIGFDDTTSFKRGARIRNLGNGGNSGMAAGTSNGPGEGGESITLADIKVGDNVAGSGSLKGGVFVPTQLNVTTPRPPRAVVGGAPGEAPPAKPQR